MKLYLAFLLIIFFTLNISVKADDLISFHTVKSVNGMQEVIKYKEQGFIKGSDGKWKKNEELHFDKNSKRFIKKQSDTNIRFTVECSERWRAFIDETKNVSSTQQDCEWRTKTNSFQGTLYYLKGKERDYLAFIKEEGCCGGNSISIKIVNEYLNELCSFYEGDDASLSKEVVNLYKTFLKNPFKVVTWPSKTKCKISL